MICFLSSEESGLPSWQEEENNKQTKKRKEMKEVKVVRVVICEGEERGINIKSELLYFAEICRGGH